MLKILQEGVNANTKRVNTLEKGGKKRTDLALNTAKKQGRVEDLTRKLARKVQKEEDPDGDDR